MTKKLLFILIFAIFIFSSNCGKVEYLDDKKEGDTGSLEIKISMSAVKNESSSKMILPNTPMTPVRYRVTGTGPSGAGFDEPITSTSLLKEGLISGKWTLNAVAYNEDDAVIASGGTEILVKSGQSTPCSIVITPNFGAGTLELEISWASGIVGQPLIEATLTSKGAEPVIISFSIEGSKARATLTAAAGYYTLNARLYDASGDMRKYYGGAVEVVRIVSDQKSEASIPIFSSNQSTPGATEPDPPEFPEVGSPSGSDIVSSSTNQSDKAGETAPKLNPLSGTGFVAPPQINNYGAVNLGYPIVVPAGRAGMNPVVGLSYSSSSGDGLLGIGWNISTGLGVIARTTKYGPPYYDARDTFTFNGQRLVRVETDGPSSSENGTYRMEIESGFMKFVLTDSENGGVWHVYDKAGTVTIFGEDLSSRVYRPDDDTMTYTWHFSQSIDLNQNTMSAVYDTTDSQGNNIIYLKEIRYTGNIIDNNEGFQYVRFHLKERDDVYVSNAPGFIMKMDQILDYVEVGWDDPFGDENNELWRYTMEYEVSEDSNRPLLKTVHSTRTSTEPEFIYQPAEHSFEWKKVVNSNFNDPENNHESTKYFEGDFNGDGISDMVFFNPETGYWRAAEGSSDGTFYSKIYGNRFKGYNSAEKIQWFKGNVTGDYNGDGRSDIAFYLPQTREFIVAEHNGNNFQFRTYGRLYITDVDIFKCEWFTGDYDGNGMSDIVLFNEKTGDWIFMNNTGGGFEFIKFSKSFQNLFRYDYSPDKYNNSILTFDNSETGADRGKINFSIGDYNGDGRTDISIYDSRDGTWRVGENYRDHQIGFRLKWKIYRKFSLPEQLLYSNERFSGDFNGDGFSDFLVLDKEEDEWILGETGDGTINFRTFSKVPSQKKITRWLQGDFNGDGRTDIGFYSETDDKFWIGEATPEGFRYVVYSEMYYGPDPKRVMNTPLPEDEVKLALRKTLVTNENGGTVVDYRYDDNKNPNRGEMIFVGDFNPEDDGKPVPEMLVYQRYGDNAGFNEIVKSNNKETLVKIPALSGVDPENPDFRFLNNARPVRSGNRDVLLYYQKTDNSIHNFNMISYGEAGWTITTIANFDNLLITNFNIDTSLYLTGRFTSEEVQVLIFHYTQGMKFKLFKYNESTDVYDYDDFQVTGDEYFMNMFSEYGDNKETIQFFTGIFPKIQNNKERARILCVDMRYSQHRWSMGTFKIEENDVLQKDINFISADNNMNFNADGYTGSYGVMTGNEEEGGLVYSAKQDGVTRFHRLEVFTQSDTFIVSNNSYYPLDINQAFNGDFDPDGYPLITHDNVLKRVILSKSGNSYTLENLEAEDSKLSKYKISRDDLDNEDNPVRIYPYQWVQGDYNGDGKTDIGLFHLKDKNWYFANTTGTIPDLLYKVNNGIGGTYTMEYSNSTEFDNTGPDNIPDLPVNYRICTKLIINDGRNAVGEISGIIETRYEYKDGYAFSDFIDGKKETDYFGFGTFTVIDSEGKKNITTYNQAPFGDYRHNRALSGAVKQSRFLGADGKEYSRTDYQYKIHEIITEDVPQPYGRALDVKSYLIEPVMVKQYMKGTLVSTTSSAIEFETDGSTGLNKYALHSTTASVTDHYQDNVHAQATVTSYVEFYNDPETNEMRPVTKVSLAGTKHETTSAYTYDSRGNLTQEHLAYTGSGIDGGLPSSGILERTVEYEYDSYGNLTKSTNKSESPYRVSRQYYDDRLHQFVTEEQAVKEDGYISVKYEINYGMAFGTVSRITDPNLNSTYYEFDSLGRLASISADMLYNETAVFSSYSYDTDYPISARAVQYTGTSDKDIEHCLYMDGVGRVIHSVSSGTGESGEKYIKSGLVKYDALGRVISAGQPVWASDDEIDNYHTNTENKNPTLTEYNASGRVKRVILPRGKSGEDTTYIEYTYNDPWETVTYHSIGRSKRTVQNARGQALYVEDRGTGEDGNETRAMMGFAYDMAGNVIKRMDLIDAQGVEISMDLLTFPPAPPVVPELPGGITVPGKGEFCNNNEAYWWYDGLGQLYATLDPDQGYSGFRYNGFGETIKTLDAENREISMQYDMLGRPVRKIMPEMDDDGTSTLAIEEYAYDYSEMEPGQAARPSNTLGRLVSVKNSILEGENQKTIQRKEFSYDTLGRVRRETRDIYEVENGTLAGSGVFVTNFKYDLLNRRIRIEYPEDHENKSLTAEYRYSAMGVKSLTVNNGSENRSIVESVDYNEFGQMDSISYGNGTSTSYVYDNRRRLEKLTTQKYIDESNSPIIQNVSYSFNIDDSIKSLNKTTDFLNNNPHGNFSGTVKYEYSYDGLNRLKGATGSLSEFQSVITRTFKRGFAYASNGNLMSKTIDDCTTGDCSDDFSNPNIHEQWTYAYENHAVQSITTTDGSFQLEYDNAGNMTQKVKNKGGNIITKIMKYNALNRIRRVEDESGHLKGNYYYDEQGFRIRKKAVKDVQGEERIVETLNPSMYFGQEIQKRKEIINSQEVEQALEETRYSVNNVYINGVRIAAVLNTLEAQYYLTDQVDSVSLVVSDTGMPVTQTEYLPFGETWFQEGNGANKPKFNSQELDEESGFYFYNARHYDAEISRFVTADNVVDGVVDTQGWNRYSYVSNSPVNYRDPTGNFFLSATTQKRHSTDQVKPPRKKTNERTITDVVAESDKKQEQKRYLTKKYRKELGDKATKAEIEGAAAGAVEAVAEIVDGGIYAGSTLLGGPTNEDSCNSSRTGCSPDAESGVSLTPIVSQFLRGYSKRSLSIMESEEEAFNYLYDNAKFEAKKLIFISMLIAPAAKLSRAKYPKSPRGIGKAPNWNEDLYVIGRQVDTAVAKDWPGHKVLDIPDWTLVKNDKWIKGIIKSRSKVYVGSPQNQKTLWDAVNNRPTVFARELEQLKAAGYKQVGDYLLPPKK